jgi:hypothetical protein
VEPAACQPPCALEQIEQHRWRSGPQWRQRLERAPATSRFWPRRRFQRVDPDNRWWPRSSTRWADALQHSPAWKSSSTIFRPASPAALRNRPPNHPRPGR